ncbi:MAG TPA: enoyl-CoA hydratase-related protein [Paracoccus sp. (in: a-proteobacteria)]|uniref:enoyl-CoA hydratase/isomerase family protein n=1 Tax=Paracoccus sp. TaxID=267 RepID=UPI002BD8C5AD|nr:enoyl-CoA hydratase-related protein [Paracoccus sp. (in: a-proteobacteria)]HWL58963.1 enoyl-CoA hydratase-related protein [Paracoccus sp. (in: a-proteobacteria)]
MGIRLDKVDGIGRITLDTPCRKNALSPEERFEMAEMLRALRFDPEVRVILLRGEGDDFCAGADVSRMGKDAQGSARTRMQRGVAGVAREMAALEKPVVSAVRGVAVGFGWSLALASDVVIASDTARFSMIFSKRGLAPDGGAVHFLIRHIGQLRAKELAFSARILGADEAFGMGLVSRVVPDASLEDEAAAYCRHLLTLPTLALGMTRHLFEVATSADLDTYLDVEAFTQSFLNQSEDYKEAVSAFLEKRPGVYHGR